MTTTDIDERLENLIDPWLEHMRWRPDFKQWRNNRLWQETKQKRTLQTLELFLGHNLANLRILDLGCGMGGLSVAMAREDADVQPYDYNVAYCEITRLRGNRYDLKLEPINGGGERLPFPNSHFDTIVCMDVLEHVQRPEDLLAEASRCLKKGGLLYITAINRFAFNDPHYHVPLVNWLPRRLATPFLKLLGRDKDNSRFNDRQTLEEMHYYPFWQLRNLAARHGFHNLKELGELELNQKQQADKKLELLGKLGLLKPLYKLYRSFYKGTYQLAMYKL